MTVAYQRLEMGPGQTTASSIATRRNRFVVTEICKRPNCPSFRLHDSLCKGFADGPGSPQNSYYKMSSPQDSVMHGFSALSLDRKIPTEVGNFSGVFGGTFLESNDCLSKRGIESVWFNLAPSSACREDPLGSPLLGSILGKAVCSQENGSNTFCTHLDGSSCDSTLSTARAPSPPVSSESFLPINCRPEDGSGKLDGFLCYPNNLWSFNPLSNLATRHALHKDGLFPVHDDTEPDTSLGSPLSSEVDMPLESSSSCSEASKLLDETEAQSTFKGFVEPSSSVTVYSPLRKGLSRFYSGKSQSFSCVRDALSVKDLAKPEHGCAKKRRMDSSADRPRVLPSLKGPVSVFKKPPNGAKSTLALAVAMSAKEQGSQVSQGSLGDLRNQNGVAPSRSYSLSDLQGAARSKFFLG